jgi:hypothetical protein
MTGIRTAIIYSFLVPLVSGWLPVENGPRWPKCGHQSTPAVLS